MLNLFLDTTVFRSDARRRSPEFTAISRLSGPYQIQVHISEISRREFVTHAQQELSLAVSAARKVLKDLRKVYSNDVESDRIKDMLDKVAADDLRLEKDFDEWTQKLAVTIHAVTGDHGTAVLDSYFVGSAPFSKVKARDDIPDALIYQVIQELAQLPEPLHVVTADKNLGQHVAALSGVTVHKTLRDFFKTAEVRESIQQTASIEQFLSFIRSPAGQTPSPDVVRLIEEQLSQRTVDTFSDEAEATITGYGEIRDLRLDAQNIIDFGDGIFSVPFEARSECDVGFFIDKFLYFHMDDDVRPRSFEDWNDHIYRVEETFDLEIRGSLSFEAFGDALEGDEAIASWADVSQRGMVQCEIDVVELVDPELREAMEF